MPIINEGPTAVLRAGRSIPLQHFQLMLSDYSGKFASSKMYLGF